MKQKYAKPSLVIERFALTQSIAEYCGPSPSGSSLGNNYHSDSHTCYWDFGGYVAFAEGNDACADVQVKTGDIIEGFCYNNPGGLTAIFASV